MTELNENVLTMLKNSEGHLTAEEAFMLAKKKKINISYASIYRILGNLASEGKIQRLSIPGHSDVFDKTIFEHSHMVCKKCGKVKDLDSSKIKNALLKSVNEEFDSFNLTINYICKECRKKGDA